MAGQEGIHLNDDDELVRCEKAVTKEGYRYRRGRTADKIRVLAVEHLTVQGRDPYGPGDTRCELEVNKSTLEE